MTSFDHLARNGNAYRPAHHLGQPETTIVSGEHYLVEEPGTPAEDRVYPDPLVAFNADTRSYGDSNAYIIAEQGKPPDFVLEIASAATADNDTGHKCGTPDWGYPNTGGSTRRATTTVTG